MAINSIYGFLLIARSASSHSGHILHAKLLRSSFYFQWQKQCTLTSLKAKTWETTDVINSTLLSLLFALFKLLGVGGGGASAHGFDLLYGHSHLLVDSIPLLLHAHSHSEG